MAKTKTVPFARHWTRLGHSNTWVRRNGPVGLLYMSPDGRLSREEYSVAVDSDCGVKHGMPVVGSTAHRLVREAGYED